MKVYVVESVYLDESKIFGPTTDTQVYRTLRSAKERVKELYDQHKRCGYLPDWEDKKQGFMVYKAPEYSYCTIKEKTLGD